MATFVLEIGSEEVPSRFLPTEEQELETRFTAALEENALEHGKIRALSTPRRAILVVEDLNPVQTEREEVVAGPPVRVAYDADGKPTKALEGFVRTNGCTLDDVFRQETPKGEYVAVRKRIGGAAAGDLLATMLGALLSNALRFTRDGNRIEVTLTALSDRALLRVRDHGTGIRPEVLPHIFAPFFSADPSEDRAPSPGAGLGLTFVQALAGRLGGTVSVESVFGEGSLFAVSLPLAAPMGNDLLRSSSTDYLLNRYSPIFLQLADFCRLPDPG